MKRKIAAILAFNIYAGLFVTAFSAATPFFFHGKELASLKDQGLPLKLDDWGFDDHYIWRLLAAIVSTVLPAVLCGAIARDKGGKIALLANIPSVIGWIATAWILFFLWDNLGIKADAKHEEMKTVYALLSIIAIPATCWLAIKGGGFGERLQKGFSQQGRTLGIADWHWAWLWLPLDFYCTKMIIATASFAVLQFRMLREGKILDALFFMLGVAIVASWIVPLVLTYQTLAGARFKDKRPLQRGVIVAAILLGGYIVAWAISWGFGWVLGKFGY